MCFAPQKYDFPPFLDLSDVDNCFRQRMMHGNATYGSYS